LPSEGPVAIDTGPRSLIRTLRILEQLAAVPQGMTLATLSVELQSPKSSLFGLLRPLCSYGYIVNTEGRYVLGPSAYRLGLSIMPTVSIARIATPIMRELAERSGETVLVAVLDRDAGTSVYIEKIESTQSIRYTVALGTTRPLYCSAAGRVLLAHADEEYIERYLRRAPYAPLTPQTLTRGAELRKLLPQVREQGLAITIGEVSSDVAGFASPIFDHQGRVIAALAMAAPVSRTRTNPLDFARLMREAADSISFGFGHAGSALTMAPGSEPTPPEPASPVAAPDKRSRRMSAATG
ncbi:MAG TPA: IclR family transcriptional regulator, partial [Albitalea sp.]|nr:IclR family transcriptional regulator [Albitalea sp.]